MAFKLAELFARQRSLRDRDRRNRPSRDAAVSDPQVRLNRALTAYIDWLQRTLDRESGRFGTRVTADVDILRVQ